MFFGSWFDHAVPIRVPTVGTLLGVGDFGDPGVAAVVAGELGDSELSGWHRGEG